MNTLVASLVNQYCDQPTNIMLNVAFQDDDLYYKNVSLYKECTLTEDVIEMLTHHDCWHLVEIVTCPEHTYMHLPKCVNAKVVTISTTIGLSYLIPDKIYDLVIYAMDNWFKVAYTNIVCRAKIKWFIDSGFINQRDMPDVDYFKANVRNVISASSSIDLWYPENDILTSMHRVYAVNRPLRAFIYNETDVWHEFFEPESTVEVYAFPFSLLEFARVRTELKKLIVYNVPEGNISSLAAIIDAKFPNLTQLILMTAHPLVIDHHYRRHYTIGVMVDKNPHIMRCHQRIRINLQDLIESFYFMQISVVGIEDLSVHIMHNVFMMVYKLLDG